MDAIMNFIEQTGFYMIIDGFLSVASWKNVVMILVSCEIRDKVLHALYENVGLKTEGHGIAFALPVQDVVGLTNFTSAENPTTTSSKQPTEQTDTKQ